MRREPEAERFAYLMRRRCAPLEGKMRFGSVIIYSVKCISGTVVYTVVYSVYCIL